VKTGAFDVDTLTFVLFRPEVISSTPLLGSSGSSFLFGGHGRLVVGGGVVGVVSVVLVVVVCGGRGGKSCAGSITGEFVGVGACKEYEKNLPTLAPEASCSVRRDAANFL
jgi:hypothetical protein